LIHTFVAKLVPAQECKSNGKESDPERYITTSSIASVDSDKYSNNDSNHHLKGLQSLCRDNPHTKEPDTYETVIDGCAICPKSANHENNEETYSNEINECSSHPRGFDSPNLTDDLYLKNQEQETEVFLSSKNLIESNIKQVEYSSNSVNAEQEHASYHNDEIISGVKVTDKEVKPVSVTETDNDDDPDQPSPPSIQDTNDLTHSKLVIENPLFQYVTGR